MKTFKLILLLIVGFCCNVASATTYYVSNFGSDAHSGTDISSAFQHIGWALTNFVGPGDTISISNGVYREELQAVADHVGNSSNSITIEPYNGGTVVIKASDVVTDWTPVSANIWKRTNWVINSQQIFVHAATNFDAADDGYPLKQLNMPDGSSASYTLDGTNYTSYTWTVPYDFPTPPLGIGPDTITNLSYWPSNYSGFANAGVTNGFNYYVPETDALRYMSNNAGTFYYATNSDCLYVRLADDSSPNDHGMEVSVRISTLRWNDLDTFMVLKNLRFRHGNIETAPAGIKFYALGAGRHTTYDGCDIEWGDTGGVELQDYSVATNCVICNNGTVGGGGGPYTLYTHCLISSNNYRFASSNNYSCGLKLGATNLTSSVEFCDIGYNSNVAGIWYDSYVTDQPAVVRNNYIHNNGSGGVIAEVSRHVVIQNNLFVSNAFFDVDIHGSSSCKVLNNTMAYTQQLDPNWCTASIFVHEDSRDSLTNNQICNNIVYCAATKIDIFLPNPFDTNSFVDYNDYWRTSGEAFLCFDCGCVIGTYKTLTNWQADTGCDLHSFVSDPGFISYGPPFSVTNFALSYLSPAIDAAVSETTITNDFTGAARPVGSAYDMGAFEFGHDADSNGIDDYWQAVFGISSSSGDADGDGISNLSEFYRGTDPTTVNFGGTLYVDIGAGNSIYSGVSPIVIPAYNGPKKHISDAVAISSVGPAHDQISVAAGTYSESTDLRGHNVTLIPIGTVDLR